jgi:uncharacterized protein (TIGR04222 family)
MDILFNNPIANMSGPIFLAVFIGLLFLASVGFWLIKSSFDWTSKMPVPNIPHEIDPFEIAFLRGGENELIRSVVFSLSKKGFLKVFTAGNTTSISQTQTQPNWTELTQIERNVLPYFQVSRETKDIFGAEGLDSVVSPFATIYTSKIAQANFLTPEDVKIKTRMFALIPLGIMLFLGLYKLTLAISNGHLNVLILIGLLVVTIVIFILLAKTKRLSALGESYVNSLQTAFDRLRNVKSLNTAQINPQSTFGAMDPTLLAVGLFGTSVLIGSNYSQYEDAFHRSSATSSCGSGCGSTSSCSSGSGDGGGGCGGCGGGCS